MRTEDNPKQLFDTTAFHVPLMTREAFAAAVGLPAGVVIAACERGLWPTVRVGKRSFVNVEALRIAAARKAEEFSL